MTTDLQIPGYVAGTWNVDGVHSDVSFEVRHLGIAKVRGRFDTFEAQIVTAENPLESSVTATIQAKSVNTNNQMRDEHIHGDDFLKVDEFPSLTFVSTGIRTDGDKWLVDGDLTVRGITKQATLALEINGVGTGFEGNPAVGFSAVAEINRSDFGVTAGAAGAVVGETIKLTFEIEANLRV